MHLVDSFTMVTKKKDSIENLSIGTSASINEALHSDDSQVINDLSPSSSVRLGIDSFVTQIVAAMYPLKGGKAVYESCRGYDRVIKRLSYEARLLPHDGTMDVRCGASRGIQRRPPLAVSSLILTLLSTLFDLFIDNNNTALASQTIRDPEFVHVLELVITRGFSQCEAVAMLIIQLFDNWIKIDPAPPGVLLYLLGESNGVSGESSSLDGGKIKNNTYSGGLLGLLWDTLMDPLPNSASAGASRIAMVRPQGIISADCILELVEVIKNIAYHEKARRFILNRNVLPTFLSMCTRPLAGPPSHRASPINRKKSRKRVKCTH